MAKYKTFPASSGNILIEVEEGSTGGAGGNLKESLGVLQHVVRSFVESINTIPEKKKPSEMNITFGFRMLEDGSLAIPAQPDQGNFRVKMIWTSNASEDVMTGEGFD